ncbi:MAG: STAS domain-containing protein [Deltaproteobacteria bacterium]
MKYSIDKKSDIVKFKLEEDNLDSMIAPDLKSEFIILRNEGVKNLILVMNEVKYIDSSGLSSILTANRLWKDHGNFILADIKHDFVNKLIEISRLDSILTIAGSIEEAEDYVKTNPAPHDEEE